MKSDILIITSAQFVDAELAAEFGQIPPAFLPVGNKRLYQHQLKLASEKTRKILTLPNSYRLPTYDERWLSEHGIEILFLSPDLTLKESLIQCLEQTGSAECSTSIIHGDTLIGNIDTSHPDQVSIARTDDYYKWAGIVERKDQTEFTDEFDSRAPGMVVSGYFKFSSKSVLLESLRQNSGFISALNGYSRIHSLRAIHYPAWLDFGHLHTYFRSKSKITTQRAFNDLDISPRVVKKTSNKAWKMKAEYLWFSALPERLKIYTPHVFSLTEKSDSASYEIEYLYMSALNEIAVFSELPSVVWLRILQACNEYLSSAKYYNGPDKLKESIQNLHQEKVFERLDVLRKSGPFSPDQKWVINGEELPSLSEIAAHCCKLIKPATDKDITISHGDFCFSNILYDFRVQSIRLIDPRGTLDERNFTPYGDIRYDIAKLCHSIIGRYDFIIAERYTLNRHHANNLTFLLPQNTVLDELTDNFFKNYSLDYDAREIIPIMINLFISMLPLHNDCQRRQLALAANALRLFSYYKDLLK
ncbi:hypothetical protein [Thalassolituus marinus]|uniref:Capsular biosynthesis protein n=1 Tax=Thalassolituus marinus TaxID=671053 RepID=A0ABS7ZRI1_9GAMM|nr:hypothetical protein [Thalassolituus marinus]MCA6063120.1 hypothetical protein [Thalassolituus marinus]